jgi:hypothetical protein
LIVAVVRAACAIARETLTWNGQERGHTARRELREGGGDRVIAILGRVLYEKAVAANETAEKHKPRHPREERAGGN